MEILSFTFGALALAALALITVFIMATIKVYKLNKQFEKMNRDYYDTHNNIYRQINDTSQYIHQSMAEDRREINSRLNALESLIIKPKK